MEGFGKIIRNKKGSIIDIIFIALVLTFFGIVVLVGLKIGTGFNDQIQGMDLFNQDAKDASNNLIGSYTHTIDNTFLFFTIIIGVVVLVLAALVRIHPIFIPFFFIGLIIVIFLSAIFSNLYQEMAADPNLADTAAQLVFMSNILNILPIIVAIFGIILMVVMYKLYQISV